MSYETHWKPYLRDESESENFNNKEETISNAQTIVNSHPAGIFIKIRVRKADGTFQTVLTYGKDLFPSRRQLFIVNTDKPLRGF